MKPDQINRPIAGRISRRSVGGRLGRVFASGSNSGGGGSVLNGLHFRAQHQLRFVK